MALSPFLNIGDMLASSQSVGSIPVLSDLLKIVVSTGASSSAASFSIADGIPSGPDALWLSRVDGSFCTPSIEIVMFGKLDSVDMSRGSSLVKTDWNWVFNISAFLLLSVFQYDYD